jgi:hypothetical protein
MQMTIGILIFCGILSGQSAAERSVRRIVSIEYPRLAILARVQGMINVRCSIDAAGKVTAVHTLSYQGNTEQGKSLLRHAIEDGLKEWLFEGADAPSEVTLHCVFILQEVTKNRFIFEPPGRITVISQYIPIQ